MPHILTTDFDDEHIAELKRLGYITEVPALALSNESDASKPDSDIQFLVGKEVRIQLPPKLRKLMPSSNGTLVSATKGVGKVRIGNSTHSIKARYIRPC